MRSSMPKWLPRQHEFQPRSPKEQAMDDEKFDRLSMQFHRLREQASRRGALGLLMGGVLAAAGGLRADQTKAKYKHHNDDYYHHHHGGNGHHHNDDYYHHHHGGN